MFPLFQTITDLADGADVLRRRGCGVIEARDGRFCRVQVQPLPKVVSAPGIRLLGGWLHRHRAADRCMLYYRQPWQCRNFLVVPYLLSGRGTSLATVQRAVEVLEHIARLKGSDALLCEASNRRLTERLMARWGWEPHCPSRWHRHFIKRFYGDYPPAAGWIGVADVNACPATV